MLNRIEMYESQTSRLAKYLDDDAAKKLKMAVESHPAIYVQYGGGAKGAEK